MECTWIRFGADRPRRTRLERTARQLLATSVGCTKRTPPELPEAAFSRPPLEPVAAGRSRRRPHGRTSHVASSRSSEKGFVAQPAAGLQTSTMDAGAHRRRHEEMHGPYQLGSSLCTARRTPGEDCVLVMQPRPRSYEATASTRGPVVRTQCNRPPLAMAQTSWESPAAMPVIGEFAWNRSKYWPLLQPIATRPSDVPTRSRFPSRLRAMALMTTSAGTGRTCSTKN